MTWWQILLTVTGCVMVWFALSVICYRCFFKRFYDILLSGLALIILSPIYIILIILVRLKLGSPVFFKQRRPGRNGKIFHLHKFRTMTGERNENGELLPDEQRMTKFGSFLRSTSLDELPEIWDIFRGKMSIIGPRPLLEKYLPRYTEEQAHRHDVRPGLTGLAQISGRNGISWEQKFALDVQYVRKFTLFTDIAIFFKTILKVFKREGISETGQATMEEFLPERKVEAETPLISVIIPVYNIENYVSDCITSVLSQSYENIEVIVVDDGSTDGSGNICDSLAANDKKVKVIHKSNGGLVSARKAGLMLARGKYICNIDGDDSVGVDFISNLYSAIEKDDSDMAIAGYTREMNGKLKEFVNELDDGCYSDKSLSKIKPYIISCGEIYHPTVYTYLWNKMIKKELLDKWQTDVPDTISIGEDAAVVFPLLYSCKKIAVTSDCSYIYRQHEGSMLKKHKNISVLAKELTELKDYLRSVETAGFDEHFTEQVDDYLLSVFLVHTGGRIDGRFIFPTDLNGKKIVLYSAGTFGQQIQNASHGSEIVSWIDEDCEEYRDCGLNVDPVSSVRSAEYDVVLIAATDLTVAKEVVSDLTNIGVDSGKILVYDFDREFKYKAMAEYDAYFKREAV